MVVLQLSRRLRCLNIELCERTFASVDVNVASRSTGPVEGAAGTVLPRKMFGTANIFDRHHYLTDTTISLPHSRPLSLSLPGFGKS